MAAWACDRLGVPVQSSPRHPALVIRHLSFIIRLIIALTQRDIREVQLAAGAIRAGTKSSCAAPASRPADLRQVLLGGGFGNFIRRSNAQRIGLLPHEVEHTASAIWAIRRWPAPAGGPFAAMPAATPNELARRTEHVDLSADPAFHRASPRP